MDKKKTKTTKVTKEVKEEKEYTKVVRTKEEKKPIFQYFLKMFIIFCAIEIGLSLMTTLLTGSLYSKYGEDISYEIFLGILALIIMLLFKNSYVFTNKQEKLSKSLLYGLPIIIVTCIIFVQNVASLTSFSFINFIGVIVLTALIGITEEFLFRGWIQNEFIERYGTSRKEVLLSILFSSLIFGLIHLTNVFADQTLFETLLQVFNATTLGFLFGAIYYRTKNIWSVILLHATYDFAIMLGEINQIKDCTFGMPSKTIVFVSSISTLILSIFWILAAVLVIKKTNYPDKRATKDKDLYLVLVPFLAFTLVLSLMPYEKLVDDYDKYYICYEYTPITVDEDYETHYPSYSEYIVDYKVDAENYIENESGLEKIISIENFNYRIFTNDDGYLTIENTETKYQTQLTDLTSAEFVVIENKDGYTLMIMGYNNKFEQEIYYTNYLLKEELSNQGEYLDNLAKSFTKLELPEIDQIGYITIKGEEETSALLYSDVYGKFIIKNGELFIMG